MRAFTRHLHFYIISVLENDRFFMHFSEFDLERLQFYFRHGLHDDLYYIGHFPKVIANHRQ